jgi:hypothetical protein
LITPIDQRAQQAQSLEDVWVPFIESLRSHSKSINTLQENSLAWAARHNRSVLVCRALPRRQAFSSLIRLPTRQTNSRMVECLQDQISSSAATLRR